MPAKRPVDNILAFTHPGTSRHSRPTPSPEQTRTTRGSSQKLHPAVRRRRLIWLGFMVVFFCWAVIELVIQQFRIMDREEQLAAKREELAAVQAETQELHQAIKKLNDEDYLLELAHKLGYSKPGEEVYIIEGN